MNLSKPGLKPTKNLFDTNDYVFKEVDMNSVKSMHKTASLQRRYNIYRGVHSGGAMALPDFKNFQVKGPFSYKFL